MIDRNEIVMVKSLLEIKENCKVVCFEGGTATLK